MTQRFEDLEEAAKITHLTDVATRALAYWNFSPTAELTLLNISENATFRVDDPTLDVPRILRVHRTGYHTREGVMSELAWMKALQTDAGLLTPQAIKSINGQWIESIATPSFGEDRFVVLFEFIDGDEPDEGNLIEPFQRLGAIAARMHHHARQWQRPDYFERLVWNVETTIGPNGNWGDWRDGPGLNPERIALLEDLATLIAKRLDQFGQDEHRFGLAHADLRIANLLETNNDTRVIDFDDCGLTWFLYDFATAVSFMEDRDDMDDLIASWVGGYRTISSLSDDEVAEIPTFLMLRRLAILAWIGSHQETELARELGVPFVDASLPLAEKYIKEFS